jgi:hypothetical protein
LDQPSHHDRGSGEKEGDVDDQSGSFGAAVPLAIAIHPGVRLFDLAALAHLNRSRDALTGDHASEAGAGEQGPLGAAAVAIRLR